MNETLKKYMQLYQKLGFSFIPVKKREKKPLIEWAEYQKRRPTPQEIQQWQNQDTNISIVCGKISGNLLVIDFDKPETYEKTKHLLPPNTPIVKTGKGYHAYVKTTSPIKKTKILNEQGETLIDFQGEGSLVVAPPSIHPTGKQYQWLTEPQQIPLYEGDPVQDFKEELGITKNQEIIIVSELLKPQKKGNRNNAALKLATFYRRKGLNKEQTTKLLTEWNNKNQPPLPLHELKNTINSAYKRPKPYAYYFDINPEKKPDKKTDTPPTLMQSKIEKNGVLYEEIYDPETGKAKFAYYDEQEKTFKEVEEVDGIKPLIDNVLHDNVVKLPTKPEEYESPKKLIEEIKQHINKYLDIDEDFRTFAAYYILLSWVYDRVKTIPYLRALGDTGCGKSRFLKVIGGLCYKPISTAGTATPAVIFRVQEKWRGTLLIDEADRRQSDTTDEVIKILNTGFEEGTPVLRVNKENGEIETHYVYGPKVLTSRYTFYDKALEARCLTIQMTETDREDIPFVLTEKFDEEEKTLRNKLLAFRLKNWKRVNTNILEEYDKIGLKGIEPRLKQTASPFFTLFFDEEIKNKFIEFIKNYNKKLVEERAESPEGTVVNALYRLIEEKKAENISSKDIAEEINQGLPENSKERWTSQRVGKYLKALGIKTKLTRIQDDGVKRIIILDEKLWKKLKRRYVPEIFEEKEEQEKQQNIEIEDLGEVK